MVANIDTGVRYTHAALVNQYRGNPGAGPFDHAGNWKDPTNVCGSPPCDNVSHGTHTMGTMVGDDGGSNQIGVAPEAQWIACKGCRNNSCFGTHLLTCGQWVLDPNEDGSGDDQPDIVNNSWGGGPGNSWYMATVDSWRAAGIFPAFSAGNSGPGCGTAGSPGDYPQSFASGATNSVDSIASFSSRGPSAFGGTKPDVAAPGVSVRSSTASSNTSYAFFSGTSMGSPHTAGSVALIWAAMPALRGNVSDTELLLQDKAVDFGPGSCGGTLDLNNTFGDGRIDVFEAAVGGGPPPPSNDPPSVTITSPITGTNFPCPVPAPGVEFVGTASDPEDGNLTGSISWTDNGSPLGSTGSPVSANYLCSDAGSHVIVAAIMDSGGLSATDTITIHIDNDPPTVTINSPPNNTQFGPCPVDVLFTGTADDLEDGSLTADISWTDEGAFFGSGDNPSKTFSCTQTGFRDIDANVVDSGGAPGSASITIEITGGVCEPKHASCTLASECCSNKCKGKSGAKKCK